MSDSFELEGAAELQKILEAVGPAIAKRAGTAGVRKAAARVRADLKSATPVITGTLRKEWGYKKLRQRRRNEPAVAYVIRIKNRYYYELLEFEGREPSERKKRYTGRVRKGTKYARRDAWPKLAGRTHPFAEAAMTAALHKARGMLISGTRDAVANEAGKVYAKSVALKRSDSQ